MSEHFKELQRCRQKWEVKRLSRSLTILTGTPNLLTTFSTKTLASVSAVVSCLSGMKIQYLEKRSITLKILQYPSVVYGKSVIKSILKCSNGIFGVSKGIKGP